MRAWIHDGYPGGSRQEFGNPINLAWKQAPSKLVLHSTEGAGYPSATTYDDGRRAPHVTVDPWGHTWRQHYPLTEAAWALKAAPEVSTNTMGAVQVEIIGTCDPRNGALPYVPGLAGDDLAYLVGLLRHIAAEAGVPWQAPGLTWRPYPASYGVSASQRLTAAAWIAHRGLIGHQHVPGNSHGDPGQIPIDQWLALGAGQATPQEGDMNDLDRFMLTQLWQERGGMQETLAGVRALLKAVGAIPEQIAAAGAPDVDEAAIAGAVLAALTPEKIAAAIPDTLAARVADELAKRLGA